MHGCSTVFCKPGSITVMMMMMIGYYGRRVCKRNKIKAFDVYFHSVDGVCHMFHAIKCLLTYLQVTAVDQFAQSCLQ